MRWRPGKRQKQNPCQQENLIIKLLLIFAGMIQANPHLIFNEVHEVWRVKPPKNELTLKQNKYYGQKQQIKQYCLQFKITGISTQVEELIATAEAKITGFLDFTLTILKAESGLSPGQ